MKRIKIYPLIYNDTYYSIIQYVDDSKSEIKDDLCIKILGWGLSCDRTMNHHNNQIRGPVYKTLANLKQIV